MVKRSRDQSQEAPSRLSWLTMVPPDSRLPFPDPLEELLAAHLAPAWLLALHQLALDHHLGRDAGVVGARLPEHVLAAHALEPAQDVLQRVVERMAHMQRAGDVRRRDDDEYGFAPARSGRPARKAPASSQVRVDAALDLGGLVGLVDHRRFA